MNYLMREQDEADEERFRKLDAAIRGNLKKKEAVVSYEKVVEDAAIREAVEKAGYTVQSIQG